MKLKIMFIVAVFVSSLAFGSIIEIAEAADEDLAQQYAPILYFEGDETCFPVDVSYHIDNSYLYSVTMGLQSENPSTENLSTYTEGTYYLDNQKGTISDDNIINDYQSTIGDSYTVYSRVTSSGGSTIIQYWMFYAFNKGTQNQHEGDWEMVQVVLEGITPTWVMYSQHHGGQKATWEQVEKDGDHMKVYVSRGSHANYLRPFSGMVGLANDIVGSNGKVLTILDYGPIEMLEDQPWLDFAGRWGEYGTSDVDATEASLLGQAGPPGPKFREDGNMWNQPIEWGNNLFAADDNIFLLEMFLYNFLLIFIILAILTICVLLYRIYRRHKTTGLGPRKISMLYIDGVNAKSIGNILCIIGIILAIYSLVNPWYVVSTDIGVTGYETHGMVDMMVIDGINGIQIQVPGLTGPMPIGSIVVPFSLLIGISLIFLIIASIGISHSKKLGRKYITKGIRLLIPIVLIIIIIMLLGSIDFSSMAETGDSGVDVDEVIGAISASPTGGQTTIHVFEGGVDSQIDFKWGFGLGGILLLVSGFILIISGFVESAANIEFFKPKAYEKPKKEKKKKSKKEETPPEK